MLSETYEYQGSDFCAIVLLSLQDDFGLVLLFPVQFDFSLSFFLYHTYIIKDHHEI